MLEVNQDTLIVIHDSLTNLKLLHDIQVESLSSLPDTLTVNTVNDNSFFEGVTAFITFLSALVASATACIAVYLTYKNKILDRKHFYYDIIVAEPCIKIVDSYSEEFMNLIKRIDQAQKTNSDTYDQIISTLTAEWDYIHMNCHQNIDSRTVKWERDLELNEKIIEILMQLEEDFANYINSLIPIDIISAEDLKNIINPKLGEILQLIQNHDPLLKNRKIWT